MNSGMGALGPGNRANLTIGRALRLMVDAHRRRHARHAGPLHPRPHGQDRLLHRRGRGGQPVGAAACRARLRPGQSVVTLIGSDAPLSISDHRSRTPEDLAYILAWAAASTWSTNWWPLTDPSVFVICPEHAADVPRRTAGPSSGCASSCSRPCTSPPGTAPRRDDAVRASPPTRPPRSTSGPPRGDHPARGRRRGRALLCCPGPVYRHGIPDRLPGGGIAVTAST